MPYLLPLAVINRKANADIEARSRYNGFFISAQPEGCETSDCVPEVR